jgi:hypothetical protein
MDAAILGLAICDCKERQVCQLTYAPNTFGKLHAFQKLQKLFLGMPEKNGDQRHQ